LGSPHEGIDGAAIGVLGAGAGETTLADTRRDECESVKGGIEEVDECAVRNDGSRGEASRNRGASSSSVNGGWGLVRVGEVSSSSSSCSHKLSTVGGKTRRE